MKKKLKLNKKTIANLNASKISGGGVPVSQNPTDCVVTNQPGSECECSEFETACVSNQIVCISNNQVESECIECNDLTNNGCTTFNSILLRC